MQPILEFSAFFPIFQQENRLFFTKILTQILFSVFLKNSRYYSGLAINVFMCPDSMANQTKTGANHFRLLRSLFYLSAAAFIISAATAAPGSFKERDASPLVAALP
jgi:hypothetical protein